MTATINPMVKHDEVTQQDTTAANLEKLGAGELDTRDIDIVNRKADIAETGNGNGLNAQTIDDDENYPDGGLRAWIVLIGVMLCSFCTFGLINAWGVFQAYYETTMLPNETPSNIAWIGSIQYSLVFFPGLITGRFFDMGYFRGPFVISSAILILTTFLVAECKQYWQFLLCQGFGVGLSSGVIFGPSMSIVGQWFKKRRGTALGFTAVGGSFGGTLFPIAARKLIPLVGFQWTMRALGFIVTAGLVVANLTMVRRVPGKVVTGPFIDLNIFRSVPYSVYCIAAFSGFAGVYTVLTYIDVGATEIGMSSEFSFYLVSIANAGSCVGRISGGLLVDRLGAINAIAPLSTAAAVLTYAWPYARSQGALIALAILYGFSTGAFASSFLAPVFALGGVGDVGRRTGMAMTFAAMGSLVGPPISGAIKLSSGSFRPVGYFAGTVILVAVALMMLTRHLVLKRAYGRF